MKSALALLAFTGAAGALGWMLLAPGALETQVEERTGFPMTAETLASNPFGFSLRGELVTIGNPSEFGGGDPLFDVETFQLKASLPALGRGEIRIEDLEIRIKRATLSLDERGRLNLDAFTRRLLDKADGSGEVPFFAERVRLVVDELVFVDNSRFIPRRNGIRAMLDVELSDLESVEEVFAPLRQLSISVGSFAL